MEVNKYVQIKKDAIVSGVFAQIAQSKKFPLLVYSVNGDGSLNVCTKNIPLNNFQNNPFSINKKDVVVISSERLKTLTKRFKLQHEREVKAKINILKGKRIALTNRKIESKDERQLITNLHNYCKVLYNGTLEQIDNKVTPQTQFYSSQAGASCCSFSKTTNPILIYIPKTWLSYFGYNATNLKAWVDFVSKCEIGFNGKILSDDKNLRSMFNLTASNLSLQNVKNNYLNIDEECFEVLIPNGGYRSKTYLYFILIRFMYSSKYWNIPLIAMKLKKNMPNATHWECLLLAHAYENYDSYYSLVGNDHLNVAMPSKYNSPKAILENIKISSMNGSFKKYSGNFQLLRDAITKEDYKTIGEFLNKYRDAN